MEVLINFIDSARFMASSLSSLVDNLSEEIQKIKCKDCNCFLEYERTNENSLKIVAYLAIKIIQKKMDEE